VYTDPYTGEQTIFAYDYEEQVPYEYTICTVTLEVTDIFVLAGDMMDFDEYQMFLQYYTAQGNRPDLFAEG